MIKLGIIGARGEEFSKLYAPVLADLHQRVKVEAVYDYVSHAANQSAGIVQAAVCRSFRDLIIKWDVDAILILSTGWPGYFPYVECLQREKPVYLANSHWLPDPVLLRLQQIADDSYVFTSVEHRLCFAPSSLRTQELLASELGRPTKFVHHLSCEHPLRDQASQIASSLGWFRWLLPGYDLELGSVRMTETQMSAEFRKQTSGAGPETIPVHWKCEEQKSKYEIHTEAGLVSILSETDLTWQTASSEVQDESLTQERSSVARQLDFFCRRLVGGLIPVHDLKNHLWAQAQTRQLLSQG